MRDRAEIVTPSSSELSKTPPGQAVCLAGEVTHVRPFQSRNGKPMAFVTLEDLQGPVDLVVFHRLWNDVAGWIKPGAIVLVRGKIDSERGEPKVLADSLTTEFDFTRPADSGRAPDPAPETSEERVFIPPVEEPVPVSAEVWAGPLLAGTQIIPA